MEYAGEADLEGLLREMGVFFERYVRAARGTSCAREARWVEMRGGSGIYKWRGVGGEAAWEEHSELFERVRDMREGGGYLQRNA